LKSVSRFDYVRFGEAFVERGLIDRDTLNHVLQQCNATRALLPEVLVSESLVSDWEVGRIACELYHLPFLTVDIYTPDRDILGRFDAAYLRQYALIPLDILGDLVTVVMPGLVASDVLEGLRQAQAMRILPVVGSVLSNRRWLQEHLPPPVQQMGTQVESVVPPLPSGTTQQASGAPSDDEWLNVFDAGEEAVQLDLKEKQGPE